MRSALVLLFACLGVAAQVEAQSSPNAPVAVRVSLDRTAIWVGDRVHVTVELVSQPGTDVLLEDLAKERLPIHGGEVLAVEADQKESESGSVRTMRYSVTSYSVEGADLVIDAFPVRYFARRTAGAGVETAPAGQVVVPRRVIAVRSTLPGGERLPELREAVELHVQPPYLRHAERAGLVLIALAIVPVGLMVLDVAGRVRRARAGRPRRVNRRQQASALEELSALDPASHEERVRALERLDALVRDHLRAAAAIPAHALTPAEIREALKQRESHAPGLRVAGLARSSAVAPETVESLLSDCERARYAVDPVSAETWSESLTTAKAILRGRTA